MLISPKASSELLNKLSSQSDIFCRGIFLSARWFVLSQIAKKGKHLVILPNKEAAEYCAADLYNLIDGDNVFFLPSSGKGIERSNYKSTLNVQRTTAVEKLISRESELSIFVSYPEAISEKIPSFDKIEKSSAIIKVGEKISHEQIIEILFNMKFEKVDFVSTPGQFSVRGSLVDIFSYSNNNPYRISFWGNEVDEINIFNCNTQLSEEKTDKAEIISDIVSDSILNETEILEVLDDKTILWLDSSDMYKEEPFFSYTSRFKRVFFELPLDKADSETINFSIAPQPVFNKNFELLSADIRSKIETGFKVYIYSEKESQIERLKNIFIQNEGVVPDFIKGKNIHNGFIDSDSKICCYSDHEIFDRFHRVSLRRTVDKSEQLTLNDLNSINVGDYVVHIDHGVGIFGGLVRMRDDMGRIKEVVQLTYKDGDVVFVSVHSLHKISRFRTKEGEIPKINKLGSKAWQTLKSNTKSKVKEIAKDLIQLYAKRKASKGFSFSSDSYLQEELESSFMYEDTPDQVVATQAIKRDMEDSCPMDRLICGDVGFGKTELAIRAAFKAATDGKQVAVLVPTTILALQHYNSFSQRLKDFPCSIDYVSRLKTTKEVTAIKKKLAAGEIDIIIGTHKILGNDFLFKDLGLLVIDEEQKFGVAAKEKLRQLKNSVDTLTLTATPIPRTLQFSLLGARDLSIINTAPPNRIPIQTEIILFDEKEIKSIINYELNRGGQLFFLHNNVQQLSSIYDILHRLVPDMKICVAHGQMESKELENKMMDFIRGDYDMLLCTTIIENGLDIPNANTIIINQAQNIGLSDLHQLRGRVGRSNRRAFCYLIVPPLVSITDDARRRLKAIEEFSDLGSGFNIAMQDLDIRGAGNMLGAEQSGFITEMGFEAYQKIIAEAMGELGLETGTMVDTSYEKFIADCTVETDQQSVIPDEYIDVQAEKLRIYKRLDSITSDGELEKFKAELTDRFGVVPLELDNLFYVLRIRNLGSKLGFEKIIVKNGMLIAFFLSSPLSGFYKSEEFDRVLTNINVHQKDFTLKQSDSRLKIVSRGVDSLSKAWTLLDQLR